MPDILIRDVPHDVFEFWTDRAAKIGVSLEQHLRDSLVTRTRVPIAELANVRGGGTKRALPPRQGQKWSPEEDELIVEAFRFGKPIGEIAEAQERTSGAIRSRLTRLGLLLPSYGQDD